MMFTNFEIVAFLIALILTFFNIITCENLTKLFDTIVTRFIQLVILAAVLVM